MSIWLHADNNFDVVVAKSLQGKSTCRFCDVPLSQLKTKYFHDRPDWSLSEHIDTEICSCCGWWKSEHVQINEVDDANDLWTSVGLATANLRNLDLSDISTPLENVRSYLSCKYSERFQLHPRLFETTVASVFRDFGYDAEVTAYSGDDGIDVILRKDNEQVGVQVKRYKNAIAVDQIRELAGALVLGGMTKGIFVTTSTFQSGAENTALRFKNRGYAIELINASRFLDALRIAQRNVYNSKEEFRLDHEEVEFLQVDYHSAWDFTSYERS